MSWALILGLACLDLLMFGGVLWLGLRRRGK